MKILKVILFVFLALITLSIVLTIILVSTTDVQPTTEVSSIKEKPFVWETATYEEKQKHIEDYLQNSGQSGSEISTQMVNQIKKRFNYPETVEFDWESYPLVSSGRVVEADSGWVYLDGNGTAKNAFGVESRFYYSVMLKINDSTIGIKEVKVNQ